MAKRQKATKKSAASAEASSKMKDMVVMVSGDRSIHEVANDLKKVGFHIDQVLHAIGQVTGRAAPSLKEKLKSIQGVADVSDTHEDFNIGPPGAPVS